MARLSDDAITVDDLKRYIQGVSDFAFEVSVLKLLTDASYSCRHSGTYDDPVSGKTREFDIHAELDVPTAGHIPVFIRLAVECKNVKPNYPLVLHRVRRVRREAFIDIIWSTKPDVRGAGSARRRYGERVRLRDKRSPYKVDEFVAKSAGVTASRRSQTRQSQMRRAACRFGFGT